MNRKRSDPRSTTPFSLGGEQAEADPLLHLAFYHSRDYEAISSRLDPHCFIIGRTGGGKSAALDHLEKVEAEHVIRVSPEDLSLPYITELGAIRFLDSLNIHLDPLFIALWKHVLVVEIIRHRYNVDSPEAKQNFLTSLRDQIKRDPSKLAALDYLNDFQGKFWCETAERIRAIVQEFEDSVRAAAGADFSLAGVGKLGGSVEGSSSQFTQEKVELTDRFQRLVNETQLARLNQMIKVLDENILDSQHFTYVVIDDLDRDWVDERIANDLVRCLFRAALDMKRVQSLKIVVALRTNIFEQLNFGSRTGAQEEKFRSLALQMKWTRSDLVGMLSQRAQFAGQMFDRPHIKDVHDLFPPSNKTRGNPVEWILDRTLLRPRDAIAFVNEALNEAAGRKRVTWDDLRAAEVPYSYKRLLALRDEWKSSYPDIDKVFNLFERAESPMPRDVFTKYLDEAMLLSADRLFKGTRWLTALSQAMWSASGSQQWFDLYQPLTRLLYRVGFIGCRCPQKDVVYVYSDSEFPEIASNLSADSLFLIHPAYHATLDIKRTDWHKKA